MTSSTYGTWVTIRRTVKTKHGAFGELQTAIARCHELGLHVYADLVFNHKMGAPSTEWVRAQHVDKHDKNKPLGDWHYRELYTHFHFDARFAAQSAGAAPTNNEFVWCWDHFD